MTPRFLALYGTPAGPEAFDRHCREVRIPLGRHLPGLRRCAVGRSPAPVRGGVPYCLVVTLGWDAPEGRATAADAAGPAGLAPVPSMIITMRRTCCRRPRLPHRSLSARFGA